MSYEPTYTKPYAGGWKDSPSTDTPVKAENLNAIDDAIIKIEAFLKDLDLSSLGADYALLSEAGYSLDLSMDDYYVLTISLKNKAGTVLSSKNVDLPIESMIIDVDYADGVLTLTLQNGNTVNVSIIDIVSGLVPETRTIAGLDLKDDITAEELKTALDIYDNTVMGGELKPWLYDTSGEEILVGVYNGKPLYRKTYIYENVAIENGIAYLTIEVDSVDCIYIKNAYAVSSDGAVWTLPYAHSNSINNIGMFISNDYKGINLRLGSAHEGSVIPNINIVLEYTKTTDAEGSGDSLTPYGIFNAKLDGIEEDIDVIEATRNIYTYNSFAQLGITSINTLTSWAGIIPVCSQLVVSINNSNKEAMFNNGLIPVNRTGGLIITNHNSRGSAFYIVSGAPLIYIGNCSNINAENISWNDVITGSGGTFTGNIKVTNNNVAIQADDGTHIISLAASGGDTGLFDHTLNKWILRADLNGMITFAGVSAGAYTLEGLTASVAELNHMKGVTSGVQAQIDALKARIEALENK